MHKNIVWTGDPEPPDDGRTRSATRRQYSRTSHTDDTGGFVLDRLTAGDWTINVVKRGYLSDAKLVSLADADATIAFSLAVDNEPTHPERPEPLARRK